MILSVKAIVVAAVGFVLTFIFLIAFIRKKRIAKLMHATLTILATTFLYYIINLEESGKSAFNKAKKKVLLTASREAPIGGLLLKLFEDSTYQLGGYRAVTATGIFTMRADTLFLFPADPTALPNSSGETAFIMKDKALVELTNNGIGWLEIHNRE